MSVEFELEDDGRVRVRVDRGGERAVSDVMDPLQMMHELAEAAGWDAGVEGNEFVVALPEDMGDSGDSEGEEPTEPIEGEEPTEPVEPPDDQQDNSPEDDESMNEPAEAPNGGDMTDDITEPAEEEPEAEPGIDESAPPEESGA